MMKFNEYMGESVRSHMKPQSKVLERGDYTISDKDVIKRKLSSSKYNPLIVRIKNRIDRKDFFDYIEWYDVFKKYIRSSFLVKSDYVIILRSDDDIEDDPFTIGFTFDYEYYDSGEFFSDYSNVSPIMTPKEMDDYLENLLGVSSVEKMYSPRKVIRSLDESSSTADDLNKFDLKPDYRPRKIIRQI